MTDTTDLSIDRDALASRVRWVSLQKLDDDACLACIDGRFEGCAIGAPGGDAGELVTVLTAVEQTAGVRFEADDVERIVARAVDEMGRFYLHSDRAAVDQLEETLADDETTARALERAGSAEALLRHPPSDFEEVLRPLIVEPRHVGCGHLKTMLAHPDEYDARSALIESLIQAFFDQLWDGRPGAHFVVLEGGHAERALVVFEESAEDAGAPDATVPALCREGSDPQLFVSHPPAQRHARRAMLDLVVDEAELDEFDRANTLELAEQLDADAGQVTLSHLAPDLPMIEIDYADGRLKETSA